MEKITVTHSIYRKDGGKSWYATLSWYIDGKRYQKTKSTKIPTTGNHKKEAKAVAKAIAEQTEKELNEATKAKDKTLLSDFMLEWLKVKRSSIRQSTYEGYKNGIDKIINPYFDSKNIMLEDLQSTDIQGFYQYLLDKGYSANTVKKRHVNISNALTMAYKQRRIPFNPVDGVILPASKKHEAEVFSLEQLQTILQTIKGEQIETAINIAIYCGLRRSEILGLTWDCVDFDNNLIHIRQTRTSMTHEIFEKDVKTESSKRDIPLDKNLKQLLLIEKQQQSDNKVLFGNCYTDNNFVCRYADGRPITTHYLSHRFKNIITKLGIEGHLHTLRHTAATILCNAGTVSIKTASAYLGHSNLATTSIYMHPDLQAKLQAATVISNMINSVPKN